MKQLKLLSLSSPGLSNDHLIFKCRSVESIANHFDDQANNFRSEGGCLPGEWGESSYKLAIRAATLVRVRHPTSCLG